MSEPFLHRLMANPVQHEIMLSRATILSAKYNIYAKDIFTLVMNYAEINKVSKEIWMYEMVAEAKINCDKFACPFLIGLQDTQYLVWS